MKPSDDHILRSDASHGNRGGGPMHSAATSGMAGFMSATDKLALAQLTSGPASKTADFTVATADGWLICDKAGTTTVTLPSASARAGRVLEMKTVQAELVVSASSDVVPLTGGAAATAILPATAGAWATLVSDGTNWIIMRKG